MFNPFPLRTGFCQSLTSLLKSRMGMQQACDFMYGGPHGYGIFTSTLLSHVISTNMPCIEIWDTYDILWLSPVWQWIYHDGICAGHIQALVSPCLQFGWHAFWSSFGVVSIFACMSLHAVELDSFSSCSPQSALSILTSVDNRTPTTSVIDNTPLEITYMKTSVGAISSARKAFSSRRAQTS